MAYDHSSNNNRLDPNPFGRRRNIILDTSALLGQFGLFPSPLWNILDFWKDTKCFGNLDNFFGGFFLAALMWSI